MTFDRKYRQILKALKKEIIGVSSSTYSGINLVLDLFPSQTAQYLLKAYLVMCAILETNINKIPEETLSAQSLEM
jgi:hypothetical protein